MESDDAALERVVAIPLGEAAAEFDYEPAEVELVLHLLWESKVRGYGWDRAWFTALRNLAPPRTCSPEVRVRVDEARARPCTR